MVGEIIKMSTVLSEINRYADSDTIKEFSLTYYTKAGKKVHRKRLCKSGHVHKSRVEWQKSDRNNPHIKDLGLLHVYNIDEKRPETPDISLITHFNGKRVWH